MDKSIREIAEEIGVSKQAVRKEIASLGLQTSLQKKGNQFVIDEKQENLIKTSFKARNKEKFENYNAKQNENQTQTESQSETKQTEALINMLQKELDVLHKQLEEKDKQLENAHKLIDQEQQLRMVSEQKLLSLEEKQDQPKERGFFSRIFKSE